MPGRMGSGTKATCWLGRTGPSALTAVHHIAPVRKIVLPRPECTSPNVLDWTHAARHKRECCRLHSCKLDAKCRRDISH